MRVAKWGNSLAVRLPRPVVEALGLKEGDDIEIRAAKPRAAQAARRRTLEVTKQPTDEEMLAELREYRGLVPAGYRFRREDAYEPD
jgi:antitoxin MazE